MNKSINLGEIAAKREHFTPSRSLEFEKEDRAAGLQEGRSCTTSKEVDVEMVYKDYCIHTITSYRVHVVKRPK